MRSLFVFITLLWCSFSFGDDAIRHNLSIAGGIAHPSQALAASQNPAGMIYSRDTKVHFSVEQGRDQGPVGLGGGILMGTEKVGGAAFLRDYNTDPGSVSRIYLFNAALGVQFDPLNTAIGIGASKTLGRRDPMDTTNSCNNWCIDIGAIYNPVGAFRVAGNVIQLSDSNYLLGGGIASDLSGELTGVIDAQLNSEKSTMIVKPGLGIFVNGLQLTGAYGFRLWGTQEAGMRQGWCAGLSSNLFENMLFEVYLNQFTYYYISATLKL
jgi:hypothetical protein